MSKMSRSEAGKLGAEKTKLLYQSRYLENPSFCKFCFKELVYNKRHNTFCNRSCSVSYNNYGVCRNGNSHGTQFCKQCKVQIFDKNGAERKFCTSECKHIYDWNLRKVKIEQTGEESSVRCAKRYLIETRGVQCEICRTKEWCEKSVPLVMDHIDGHSENNNLDNLRLVCGNCDMQLPTYKSKNKGNGRAYRRKRYAEGKSF